MRLWDWAAGCLLFAILGVAGCQSPESSTSAGIHAPEGEPVPIFREFQGQLGPFPDAGFQVIQRQEAWSALWAPRESPDVDFSRQAVLVATLGGQANTQAEVTITDVRATNERIIAYVTRANADGSTPAHAVSFPYHMVVVPRISQPATFVVSGYTSPLVPLQDQFLGPQSHIPDPRVLVIRDQQTWRTRWTEAFGPTAAAPAVDFTQYTAVAVFLGRRSTTGYAVRIVSATVIDDRLTINYRVNTPAPEEATLPTLTAPYAIALLPLSTLPVAFHDLGRPAP